MPPQDLTLRIYQAAEFYTKEVRQSAHIDCAYVNPTCARRGVLLTGSHMSLSLGSKQADA
jgi:hypothetical protein